MSLLNSFLFQINGVRFESLIDLITDLSIEVCTQQKRLVTVPALRFYKALLNLHASKPVDKETVSNRVLAWSVYAVFSLFSFFIIYNVPLFLPIVSTTPSFRKYSKSFLIVFFE